MPGSPATSSRQSIRFCGGEGYLDRASNNSLGFTQDLHIVREMVQQGATPKSGLETMESQERLSENQRIQLEKCLGKIANGACPIYPAKISTHQY